MAKKVNPFKLKTQVQGDTMTEVTDSEIPMIVEAEGAPMVVEPSQDAPVDALESTDTTTTVLDQPTAVADDVDIYEPYVPPVSDKPFDINHCIIMPKDAMFNQAGLSLTQMMNLPTVRDVYWVCGDCATDTRKYRDGYHVCAEFDEGHIGSLARDKPICPECGSEKMVFHIDGNESVNTPVWDIEHQCWRANIGQVWDVSAQPGVTHCPFCCSLAPINEVSPKLWDCNRCKIRIGNPYDEVKLPEPEPEPEVEQQPAE